MKYSEKVFRKSGIVFTKKLTASKKGKKKLLWLM